MLTCVNSFGGTSLFPEQRRWAQSGSSHYCVSPSKHARLYPPLSTASHFLRACVSVFFRPALSPSFPSPPHPRPSSLQGDDRGDAGGKERNWKEKKSKVSFFLFGFVRLAHVGRFVAVTHLQGNQLCLLEWRLSGMHTDSRCLSQKYVGKQIICRVSMLANVTCFRQNSWLV